jgi:FkbM family methyltransferase
MSEALQISRNYEKYFSSDPSLLIDVGCNIGRVANDLLVLYPDISIVAIEPYPEIYDVLSVTNPSFDCHKLALSDFVGEAQFFTRPLGFENGVDGQLTGDSSLMYRPLYQNDNSITVSVTTADLLLEQLNLSNKIIDIVKIDVEGAALQVIHGFNNNIKNVKLIHVELENRVVWDNQATKGGVLNYLIDLGFSVAEDDDNGFQSNVVLVNKVLADG